MTDMKTIPIYFPYMKNTANISGDKSETYINLNTYIEQMKKQLIEDINVFKKEILIKLKDLNFKDDIIIKSTNHMFGSNVWYTEFENEKFEMLETIDYIKHEKLTNELKKLLEKIYVIYVKPFGAVPIDHGEANLRHVKLTWDVENNNINLHIQDITNYEFMNI